MWHISLTVLVSHEDVISQLEADTLNTESAVGVNGGSFSCGSYQQLVHIKIQVGCLLYTSVLVFKPPANEISTRAVRWAVGLLVKGCVSNTSYSFQVI